MYYDLVVVGGGPAGLAAAEEAKRNGAGSVLIIERDKELGGILNQCIHSGFGLHLFKEQLSDPTTAGVGDSALAMTYEAPRKDDIFHRK